MVSRLFAYFREHRFAGGVTILAVTQFAASATGLFRDRLLAQTFAGQLNVIDTYFAAFRPSDLLFQTCIVSALGTVLVPVLAGYKATGNRHEMARVLNGTMAVAGVVFGVIALLMAVFLPWLASSLVQFTGPQLDLYIQFGRIALLTNFLFVFGNALGQFLITDQRYWIYGITPILYTLGTIVGTVFLTPVVGAFGPIYGTFLGVCVYVLLRFIGVWRAGGFSGFAWWHPELPHMTKLMLPRVISIGAYQMQLLFFDRFASGLSKGSITVNSFARNFQSVLVGVVGIAIAQSLYSILSQSAATGNGTRFRTYLRKGIWSTLALTICGAVVLVAASPVIVWFLHIQNLMHIFVTSLVIYAISIPFESLIHLQLRSFYAFKQTLKPAVMGLVGGVIGITAAWYLTPFYGIYGIAIAYTLGEIIECTGLALILPGLLRQKLPVKDDTSDIGTHEEHSY